MEPVRCANLTLDSTSEDNDKGMLGCVLGLIRYEGGSLALELGLGLAIGSEFAADGLEGAVAGILLVAVGGKSKNAVWEGDGVILEGASVVVGNGAAILAQFPGDAVLVGCSPEVVVPEIT